MNNNNMMNYDDAKKLRRDLLTIILFVVAIFVVVFLIVRVNEINQLKDDIATAKEEKKAMENYNKKIDEQREKQTEKVGLKEVKEEMTTFNDLFFNWKTWGEYDENMKELRQLYPQIDEGSLVDISGKDVGSGQSPKSSYDEEYFTTTKESEIAEPVTQTKEGISDRSSTFWFIIGNKEEGKTFNINHMKRYRELNPN